MNKFELYQEVSKRQRRLERKVDFVLFLKKIFK